MQRFFPMSRSRRILLAVVLVSLAVCTLIPWKLTARQRPLAAGQRQADQSESRKASASRRVDIGAKPAADTNSSVTWMTDLEAAKQTAASDGRDLLINFTGLSWCHPCLALEREVFESPEFASAAQHFVLVRLDYDRGVRRLPQEPPEPNVSWRDYYVSAQTLTRSCASIEMRSLQ